MSRRLMYKTVNEIAEELKKNVTARTVYRWLQDGRLGYYKLGHSVRVSPADYQQFLKHRHQPSTTRVVEV